MAAVGWRGGAGGGGVATDHPTGEDEGQAGRPGPGLGEVECVPPVPARPMTAFLTGHEGIVPDDQCGIRGTRVTGPAGHIDPAPLPGDEGVEEAHRGGALGRQPYRGGGAEFDFKLIQGFDNHTELGEDYQRYIDRTDWEKESELLGGLRDCDDARVYQATVRRRSAGEE